MHWAQTEFPGWISLFFVLVMQKPSCIHTVVLSYIIAFSTSVGGGVLMLYNSVLILYSPKTTLWFVTKSLLTLVVILCQRPLAWGLHGARLYLGPTLTKNRKECRSWLRWMSSQTLRGSQCIKLLSSFHFTHMKFLPLYYGMWGGLWGSL